MKLTIVKSDSIPGWYLIERLYHEHREWIERTHGGHSYQYSGRITDADVEGTGDEMIEIARAILSRGTAVFKRCAVSVEGNRVFLWSPRNSRKTREVSYGLAEELANLILRDIPCSS